jgi:hypothetical protein
VEHRHIGEVAAGLLEHAGRRVLPVDLRIALVGEHHELVLPRERDQAPQIGGVGDRALRVRGRRKVEGDGAREQLGRERVEIGQEAVRGGGVEIDRLAVGRDRSGRIDRVERVRDQHRGPSRARARPAPGGDRRKEQAFARAGQHQNLAQRVDRPGELVAPAEPAGDGAAKALGAGIGRIAAEIRDVRGEHRSDEGRNRVLRLADRDADRRLARLHVGQQLGQPHERRARVDGPDGNDAFGDVHDLR